MIELNDRCVLREMQFESLEQFLNCCRACQVRVWATNDEYLGLPNGERGCDD